VIGSREDIIFDEYFSMFFSQYAQVLNLEKTPIASIDNAKKILKHLNSNTDFLIGFSSNIQDEDLYELDRVIDPQYIVVFPVDSSNAYHKLNDLIRNRTVIINQDIKSKLKVNKKKAIYYSLHNGMEKQPHIQALQIRPHKLFTILKIKKQNEKPVQIRINVLTEMNMSYILPCIYIASIYGLKTSTIAEGIENITPVKGFLYPYINSKRSYIVDASKITTHAGITNVCKHGKLFDKRKIIIMDTTLPLSKSEWIDVGYTIGTIYQEIILTENVNKDLLLRGIIRSKGNCKLTVGNRKYISQVIEKLKKDDCLFILSVNIHIPKNYEAVYKYTII